jgi:CCR4-NOT transcription complex subunit 1
MSETNYIKPLQAEEWLEIVEQQFYPWAAQYLITERVSIEPNFHELYLQFVETLCQNEYANHVLSETYNNIKVIVFFCQSNFYGTIFT